ncbi:nuclear factor NF-kappa-B p105 subunit-like [Chanos chanos]|uniref:Nuclear factor NF-kappa-B p105 subunit-like n=1 Tax=Chanos chanos TaxID=29144 RepID=A0A6J2UMP8_CHACN|nr:nuclear factor NF-kappa-B p105 subunit-like [Chanos chanos]
MNDITICFTQTPLHLAVVTQQKEAVEALLEAGADASLTDRHGNTALHLAAQQNEGDMVALLLKHKAVADFANVPNTAGLCPLHLAVLSNSLTSLRALLRSGANVEVQELTSGRTALHLAVEQDNISLAGCLLLEGSADVDSCTYNGSTPLHIAAGRGSVKMSALLMAAGADPHKENFEPLFFREDESCAVDKEEEEEEEEDEGYIPGTTPLNMAASSEVREILTGKEYRPGTVPVPVPPEGDMRSLTQESKRALCQALEEQAGSWERLAQSLGLGILTSAFRLSPSPASTLLDSYEVSGGTVRELLEGLKTIGNSRALTILQEQGMSEQKPHTKISTQELSENVMELKLGPHEEGGVCDSGVETSFQNPSLFVSESLCGHMDLHQSPAQAEA